MSFHQSAVISTNVIGTWELYLLWRQRRSYCQEEIPAPLKDFVTQEEFQKTQEYGHEKATFEVVGHIKDLVLANVQLLWKLPAKLYYFVAEKTKLPIGSYKHCYTHSVLSDILFTLISIPFSYYYHFVIEKKHGFNKMTKWQFAKDEIKSFLLRAVLLHPIQTGVIQFVIEKFGDKFPLYFFTVASVLAVFFITIYPTVIQPLFSTFTPVDKSTELYKEIESLTTSVAYPLKKVLIVDESRRSAHSNAYLYGFWKNKRIVIYDTLLEQVKDDDEQLLAVICHELGHWKHGHTRFMLCLSLLNLMAISYGAKAAIFNPELYHQFGFKEANPNVGFELYSQVFLQPIMTLYGYALMSLTRVFEFQADRFAVSMKYAAALRRALTLLAKENKSNLTPDPLYTAFFSSHPTVIERIAAIESEEKKNT